MTTPKRHSLTIAATFLLIGATTMFAQTLCTPTNNDSLTKVEQLTDQEQAKIAAARGAIEKAQNALGKVEAEVAAAHKMSSESYMEWSSWYEFNGKFILQHYRSAMSNFTFAKETRP